MNIYRDELRRQLRDLDTEHAASMPKWRDALMRLFVDDKETSTEAKAQVLLGGFNRRKFLALGGGAAVSGAVLAACGSNNKKSDTGSGSAAGASSTTAAAGGKGAGGNKTDITIARTAASLEVFAVSVYDTAIKNAGALGIQKPVATAAQTFRDHHQAHADAFNAAAKQLGGEAFTQANPQAQKAFADRIKGLKTQDDVVKFAYDLETVAAETYQGVGAKMLSTPQLRQTAMSVGGVEAKHIAILATLIQGKMPAPNAFQPTDQAVTQEFFV